MSVKDQVIELISDQLSLKKEEIAPGSRLVDDLKADSLDVVELVMSFEENFDMQIPDEEAEQLQTVEDIIGYVKKHKNSSSKA